MMHTYETKLKDHFFIIYVGPISTKQEKWECTKCSNSPNLDLVEPFFVVAIHLGQVDLPNAVLFCRIIYTMAF